jgi:methionyl-tRNA synthetase
LLAQENKKNEINHFLFVLANGIRTICCLLKPILIDGCEMICDQMQFSQAMIDFYQLLNLDLIDNHKVGVSTPIYLRKQ